MKGINRFRHFKAVVLLTVALSVQTVKLLAQNPSSPISWSFASRQVGQRTFEVYTIVTADKGWRFRNQTKVDTAPILGRLIFLEHPNVAKVSVLNSYRTISEAVGEYASGDTSHCRYESYIRYTHLVELREPVFTQLFGEVNYSITNDLLHAMLQDKINFSILLR